MTQNHTHQDAALTDEISRHIDEHQGDYPLVILENDGPCVVALYKNTEVEIVVDPNQPNWTRRGRHPADLYATSVAEAIRLISQVEAVRQNRRYPMLRF